MGDVYCGGGLLRATCQPHQEVISSRHPRHAKKERKKAKERAKERERERNRRYQSREGSWDVATDGTLYCPSLDWLKHKTLISPLEMT